MISVVQADAVRQVVDVLRTTGLDGQRFRQVLLAGHSLGSEIAVIEAGTYKNVDGLLITGMTHHLDTAFMADVFANHVHPAALDPAFAGAGMDPGYLTTSRARAQYVFHEPGDVDPQVVAVDKRTKDVLSSAEPLDGNLLVVLAPYSAAVAEPVMIAIGQYDRFFCPPSEIDCSSPEALLATEGANYAGARCVDAVVMPNTGHDLAIQPSAPVSQSTVVAWADAVVAERESQWRFAC